VSVTRSSVDADKSTRCV